MAYPPAYVRAYSFTDFETLNPGVPKPGPQLDAEYDAVSNALTGTQNALALIQRADGELANESVGADQLEAGLFDAIGDAAVADAEAAAAAAAASASAAAGSATSASASASAAGTSAGVAAGSASAAGVSQGIAQSAADDAAASAAEAVVSANEAETAANSVVNSVSQAQLHEEKAFQWAEYLAAPVMPAPPGWPEAVDDGMFSAKWWALRARDYNDTDEIDLGAAGADIGEAFDIWDAIPGNDLPLGQVYATWGTPPQTYVLTGDDPSDPASWTNITGPAGAAGPPGPAGAVGPAGPPNTLAIGTVTTGAPGSPADATITGTAPNQTLSLTIPAGADGAGTTLVAASGTIGLAAVAGVATTAPRSDSTPALSQAIVPTWSGAHTFNALVNLAGPLQAAGVDGIAGQTLASQGAGLPPVWRSPGGGSVDLIFAFNSATAAADPGAQKFAFNNAAYASVTAIYYDITSQTNFDASTILSLLTAGNRIYLQQRNDATRAAIYQVTGAATNMGGTNWFSVPVTVINSQGVMFANNADVTSVFMLSSSAGAAVADPTATIGLTVVNGVAATAMRSDAAPPLSQAIAPTWSATHTFSLTPVVPNDSWTYAKIQNVSATSRVLGRITAGAGDIEELTGANIATILGSALPSGANPTASVGLTAVNGSALTFLRSDGAPALDQAIAPTWSGIHNFGTIALQSTARAGFRARTNAIEWGHTNTAGFANTIGYGTSNGAGHIAFNAEHGTTANTFRTRGVVGRIIQGDSAILRIGRAALANADDQALTTDVTVAADGGMFMAAVTGGSKGSGTINATGLYINNVAVGTGAPGGATTQIQYNSAGAFAGSANFVFDGTNTVTLGPASGVGIIQAATLGALRLFGGATGGSVLIRGGDSASGTGNIQIRAGDGTASGNHGSPTTIGGGNGNGAGNAGDMTVNAGATTSGAGGNLILNGGQVSSGTGGGYITHFTGTTGTLVERFRILANGAWSVGTAGTAVGTSGQVLTSTGATTPPTWQTPALAAANFANPSASLGLTAINGSATTAMRSDAAPALSQAIAPTWTGIHTFSGVATGFGPIVITSTRPAYSLHESDAAADGRYWFNFAESGTLRYSVATDAGATADYLTIGRTLGAVTSVSFGNATNNNAFNFLGTGVVTSGGAHRGPDGAVGTPSYSFTSDTNTGLYLAAADQLGITANGTNIGTFYSGGLSMNTGSFRAVDGSTSIPGFTFVADPDTGFYRIGANNIGVAAGNAYAGGWINAATNPQYAANDGSAAAPSVSFQTDLDTGMYHTVTANELGFATGGTVRLTLNTTALTSTLDVSAPGFTTTSSRAIKRVTGAPRRAADMLARLRPLLYRLLAGDDREQLGLIAEEVHEVCPQLSDGKTVSYDRLAILLLAAWQDEHAEAA